MATIKTKHIGAQFIEGNKPFAINTGTILKVVSCTVPSSNVGKIVMRTNSLDRPFISLNDGDLWYSEIEEFTFEIINQSIELSN